MRDRAAGRTDFQKKAKLAATALLIALAAFFARSRWLPAVAEWLDVGAEYVRADLVLALPGDDERRPFVAAALVNVGLVQRAVVVENLPTPEVLDGLSDPSHKITCRIYAARGLRRDQIVLLPSQSTSTADDLDALGRYLAQHPGQRACVVTNAYHTRRTRWTARNRLPELASRIAIVSAPNPEFDSHDWWQSNVGLECVLTEYLKLGWYFVRGGQGAIVIGASMVAVMAIWLLRLRLRLLRTTAAEE